jgi:geranylgeranylglycerol-phosphate geranylgeranyltransferase
MNKWKGYFQLMRCELPFAAGVCVLMGQLLALAVSPPLFEMWAGFLSIFLLSASILVLNDFYDIETDRVNAPDRPIPRGAVSSSGARLFSILLLSAGLLLGALLGATMFVFAAVLALVGFLYNREFKRTGLPGNLMVSFSSGATFIYGGTSVGMPFHRTVWFFALLVALIDLGEEIAADAMDAEGDRLIRSRSLAISLGRTGAVRVSCGIFFSAVALTAVPFLLRWFGPLYIVPIGIMDISIAYSAVRLLQSDGDGGRIHIRRIYLGGTGGLVLFLLMKLSGF